MNIQHLDYLLETAEHLDLVVDNIPPQFEIYEAFNQSDQISFASAGIPSILVLEGIKNKHLSEQEVLYSFIYYMINRYHTPFDDLSQQIDYMAAAQYTEVLFDLVCLLSNLEEPPEWNPGSPFINARLRSRAEKR